MITPASGVAVAIPTAIAEGGRLPLAARQAVRPLDAVDVVQFKQGVAAVVHAVIRIGQSPRVKAVDVLDDPRR